MVLSFGGSGMQKFSVMGKSILNFDSAFTCCEIPNKECSLSSVNKPGKEAEY